jgi:NitT/TauT family transport system substrate-binding protein
MANLMPMKQTRRGFLTSASMAVGAALLGARQAAAEERLETTSLRFLKSSSLCSAPQYIAEELLRAEGFTDIRFVDGTSSEVIDLVAHNRVDFNMHYGSALVSAIDDGAAVTILAGVHVGCFALFVQNGIGSVIDLKGKSIAFSGGMGSSQQLFAAIIVARVGLDPTKDVRWVPSSSSTPVDLFADGKVDAFLGVPPQVQEAQTRRLGHVLVNSSLDDPWSQYFCCMWAGNRDFVRAHPVATKRALRAVLKAADLCASEPARVAQRLVDGRFTSARYEYVQEALSNIPYDRWREFDAEDTVRFYALRLHELGFVKSDPQKIIAEGTDWRFLDELKRELKA